MNRTIQKQAGQAGFTLIEVIAVLVILAVLAAVAIPRYIDLINDARDKALDGAVAAGLSHTSLAYGRFCLQNNREPSPAEVASAAGGANSPNSEDYTFAFAAIDDGVQVTATETRTAPRSLMKVWLMP